MKKKFFCLFENKYYLIAFIITAMTMAPTNKQSIGWYSLGAVLSSSFMIAWIAPGSKFIVKRLKKNSKLNIPILLFSIAHSFVLSKSFYLIWLPSNKVAALASHFRLSSSQLLYLIILVAFPCMVCSLFILFSFFVSKYQSNYYHIVQIGVIFFFALMSFQISQGISCSLVGNMPLKHVFCGTLMIFALIALTNTVAANITISVPLATLPFLLFSTANYYVYSFRGRELCPFDILSVKTALNVVNDYHFFFSLFVLIGFLSWVFLMTPLFLTEARTIHSKNGIRLISFSLCLLSVLLVFTLEKNTAVKSWTRSGSALNGTVLNFILQIRDSKIEPPENYSTGTLELLEKEYKNVENAPNTHLPSILVIMNESFTDFGVLGNAVQTKEPLLPFISSLTENTIKGHVYSSVYGGNTANSEFEFLTGNSMAFLPSGSVPYQQFLSSDQYSMLTFLHSIGYYCAATHPFFADGWNRPNVYSYLGFDEMTFISDYPQSDLVRKYISDQEMYEYIIKRFDERDRSRGFFLFGISIQNHGGYTYTNFESTVPLDYPDSFPEAEQFLSLSNISDKAIENLILYLSDIEDPVVVCFFGDHQPMVESDFLEEVHGGEFNDLDSEMQKYKVPFFIWANYDIEEKNDIETSINYLSTMVLSVCGFKLPAYNQFLSDMQKTIPILTANGYYSQNNGRFIHISESTGVEKDLLNRYHVLQYNNMFDKKQLSVIFQSQ
jgi:phosphoglycerol transferase MdoB-like AlkP superfamily enzyme